MATVIDLLRQLGRHAAPHGENALAGPVMLPGVGDAGLTLPLAPKLVTAWSAAVGRTTLGHHALALSAAQAGESVALMGHGAAPDADLLLLAFSRLRFEHTALWIIPDDAAELRATLGALADQLGIRWVDAGQPRQRIAEANLVVASPQELHSRILRFHDRGWRWLWPRLKLITIPQIHRFTTVKAGHLRWLVRRAERLAGSQTQLLASVASIIDAEGTLQRLLSRPLRVIAAPAGPTHSTLAALWRSGSDRSGTALQLASQLATRKLAVTVLGRTPAETAQLRAALEATTADAETEARVAIVTGVPQAAYDRQALLRSGYRLLLMLAGDEPHEQLLWSQPELLLQALPQWPIAISNPYIAADELACAAAEMALTEAEIDEWQMRELRDRLLRRGVLSALPSGDLWQGGAKADDPYDAVQTDALAEASATVRDPNGRTVGSIVPALLDRIALPGQVYAAGLRVATRDDTARTVQLAADPTPRLTPAIADVQVDVREELAARSVRFGKLSYTLTRGKVLVVQRTLGYQEYRTDGTRRRSLDAPAETQWSASACWITLPAEAEPGATVGWAAQQAVPFMMLAPPAMLIVAYRAPEQRLFFIEAEPGGVGLIDCVYDRFERVIELASQLVQACAGHPLMGALAEDERRWLGALQGLSLRVAPPAVPVAAEPAPMPVPAAPQVPAPQPKPAPSAPKIAAPQPQSVPSAPKVVAPPPQSVPKVATPQPQSAPSIPRIAASASAAPMQSAPPAATSAPADRQALAPRPVAAPVRLPPAEPATVRQTTPAPAAAAASPAPAEVRLPEPAATPAVAATPEPEPPAIAETPTPGRETEPAAVEQTELWAATGTVEPAQEAATAASPAALEPAAETPRAAPDVPEAAERSEIAVSEAMGAVSATAPEPEAADVEEADLPSAGARRAAIYTAPETVAAEPSAVRADEPDEIEAFFVGDDDTTEADLIYLFAPSAAAAPAAAPAAPIFDFTVEDETERALETAAAEHTPEEPAAPEPAPFEDTDDTRDVAPIESESFAEPEAAPIESEPAIAPEAAPIESEPVAEARAEQTTEPAPLDAAATLEESDAVQLDAAATAEALDGAPLDAAAVEAEPAEIPMGSWRRRAPAPFLIDDLLPPLEEEAEPEIAEPEPIELQPDAEPARPAAVSPIGDDDADEADAGDADGEPDVPPRAQITELRLPPRPARAPERPAEPRPPLQFRRPEPAREDEPDEQHYRRPQRTGTDADAPEQRGRPLPPPREPAPPERRPPTPPAQEPRRWSAPAKPEDRPREPQRPPERERPDRGTPRESQPPVQRPERPAASRASEQAPAASNVSEMIARMRRLREQREAEVAERKPEPARPAEQAAPAELRFHIGERVQCLPYGTGVVRASRLSDGREIVVIDFPDYGEIEVDPAVSLVRQLQRDAPPPAEWRDDGE